MAQSSPATAPATPATPVVPLARRRPYLTVLLVVGVLLGGGGFLMHAERQAEVVGLLIGFCVLLTLADRTAFGREVAATCRSHSGFGNAIAMLAALAILMVFREEHYTLLMLATVALFATACAGLNLQLAFAGVANFAGAAFFCVGAYAAALLATHTALPHLMVLAGSGLVAGVLGLVLLLPVLRTRGHYAALVTIAFGLLLRTFLEVNDTFGGPQGLKVPGFEIFGVAFNQTTAIGRWDVSFYLPYALLSVALFALAFALMRRLENSWIGIALDAVRSDEVAASVFGLSIARWKAVAFLIGNALIGVAGALYGMMNGFVNPNGAGLGESLMMLSIIVLGGLGNLWGVLCAGVVILVIPEKLQAIQEYRLLIFALLVIAILRFRPSGILPRPLRDLSRAAAKGGNR